MILEGFSEYTKDVALVSYSDLQGDLKLKEEYLRWLNDFEVITPIISPELMKIKTMDFIEKSFQRFTSEDCQGFFIKYKPLNDFIGTIKLDNINLINKTGELGIMIGAKKVWNRQIGTKASLILMEYAFNTLNLHKVWGGTDEHNIAMQKLFLKLGFQPEGRLRKVNFQNEQYSDNFYYGILSDEYKNL
jgi:[ribosomal protein S5]-alanine N-acetyltransferase